MESNPRPVANLIALMDPLDSITDSATPWAALSNDTTTVALTDKHLTGTKAISFAKVNGAANTIFGCIAKTIPAISLGDTKDQTVPGPRDMIRVAFYLSSITDVAYAFVRLGTDVDNYNEWRIADSAITAAEWKGADIPISSANYSGITGTGWNPKAITYIAVGVAFDAETNTLSGIVFDHLAFSQSLRTDSAEAAQVSVVATVTAANLVPVTVTLSLDTSIYASGDLLADTQEIAAALLDSGGTAKLVAMRVADEDAQGAAFDVYLTSVVTSFGTENSAPNISDANLRNVQHVIPVDTGDYRTVSGTKFADFSELDLPVVAVATSMYVAVVNGTGTPTYTASGVRITFWFAQ